ERLKFKTKRGDGFVRLTTQINNPQYANKKNMAEIVRMPKLSDTMTDGVVAEWHKKVGDKVSEGDLLAEIETDMATMEFDLFYDGVLLHIGVEKGGTAPVNAVLAVIGEKGEDVQALLKNAGSAKAVEAQEET